MSALPCTMVSRGCRVTRAGSRARGRAGRRIRASSGGHRVRQCERRTDGCASGESSQAAPAPYPGGTAGTAHGHQCRERQPSTRSGHCRHLRWRRQCAGAREDQGRVRGKRSRIRPLGRTCAVDRRRRHGADRPGFNASLAGRAQQRSLARPAKEPHDPRAGRDHRLDRARCGPDAGHAAIRRNRQRPQRQPGRSRTH